MAGHSVDDYLETIYFLAFPIGEYHPTTGTSAIAARVAEMLGVSRASAGEMLKRLEADGLVERGEQKEAILTEAGIERAEKVVRKHRIIERLLTDFMGYTPEESHVQADELGDTFTDDMIERINERLGHPDRCPHGWPVDTATSTPRTRSSFRCRHSRRGSARPSSAWPSTTASFSIGSTPKGSSPDPPSTSARHAEPRARWASLSRATSAPSVKPPPRACSSASSERRFRHLGARADQALRQHLCAPRAGR